MKHHKKSFFAYLSGRAALLLAASGFLNLILIAALGILCFSSGRFLWAPFAALAVFAALAAAGYHILYRPYREIEKILSLFADGYTLEGAFALSMQMSPGSEQAILYLEQMVNSGELLSASRRQAQVLALQNQINPHFLYNTLEGIRGEALAMGCRNVADMTEALSTFFRYTISNLEHLVTLEEEIANIENYFMIQKYRFGDRISLSVDFDNEQDRPVLLAETMPKLTLQPLVENAIVHGIEGKVGQGQVCLLVQGTEKRLLIRISDNGLGIEKKKLDEINHKLNSMYEQGGAQPGRRGGIAVANVNNRIRLLFGEEYGICLYSTPGQGTDAEITLPRTSRQNKSRAEDTP